MTGNGSSSKPVDRISPDDLAYHRHIVQQQMDAQAAANSWSAYLSAKYQLRNGDSVDLQGAILRGITEESTNQAITGLGAKTP